MTLFEAISARHSVRAYTDKPIDAEAVQTLRQEISAINAEAGLHVQLVLDEPKAFDGRGKLSTYGKFSGCANYIVMAGRPSDGFDLKVGYYGERLVLLAQTLGLNSCWVGLTYKKVPGSYVLDKDEKIACVISLGYGVDQGRQHRMKSIEDVSNFSESHPAWFQAGVNAVLLAPSAVNQQKSYFELQDDLKSVKASARFSLVGYTGVDLGIARLHFELGVKQYELTSGQKIEYRLVE